MRLLKVPLDENAQAAWSDEDSDQVTFDSQIITKTGQQQKAVDGSLSSTIEWTIQINVPYTLTDAAIYDLLTPQVSILALDEAASDAESGIPYAEVELSGQHAEQFAAHAWRVDADTDAKALIEAVQTKLGAHVFPTYGGDSEARPSALLEQIDGIKQGEFRDLVIIVPQSNGTNGNELSSQSEKYEVSFSTNIRYGWAENDTYEIFNIAYITYKLGGTGGVWEAPETEVDYRQLAIDKYGSYDASNRITTWTLDINKNQQDLTHVIITDTLGKVLHSNDTAQKSILVPVEGGSPVNLVYWVGETEKQDVAYRSEAPDFETETLSAPVYTYDAESETLTIYVEKMDKETYHFQFQTEGVGTKFFGYVGDTENNETAETDLNVTQTNEATMQSGKQNVKDTAQVTCQNKFFDKVNRAPDSSSAAYDPAENTFWWALYLNCYDNNGTLTTFERKLTDVTVTDKLPDGTSLVDWTLYQVNGESLSQVTDPEILKNCHSYGK